MPRERGMQQSPEQIYEYRVIPSAARNLSVRASIKERRRCETYSRMVPPHRRSLSQRSH